MNALLLLLLADVSFRPLELGEPVLDARVVDLDRDGAEDLVALTGSELLLFRGGAEGIAAAPSVRRPAPALAVVGRGLLGVVRAGRLRLVRDPFGTFEEGGEGLSPLLGAVDGAPPALVESPGDLDGDGADDPLLATEEGFETAAGLVPLPPAATLEIGRNESFAVGWQLPVPVVGDWSGGGRELVLLSENTIHSFRGTRETDRLPLPFGREGESVTAIRRDHALVRDVDGDGRLDLLVVRSEGAAGLFGNFEATAMLFPGGRVYDRERKGFYRPASVVKVAGGLLAPELLDVNGDGRLDLLLATVNLSVVASATGSAPGTFYLFPFAGKEFARKPAWALIAPVPLSAFTERPESPVRFLPDYDGDGRPEAIAIGEEARLLRFDGSGSHVEAEKFAVPEARRPALGRTFAAIPYAKGLLLAEAKAR